MSLIELIIIAAVVLLAIRVFGSHQGRSVGAALDALLKFVLGGVVLLVILAIAFAFIGYERVEHRPIAQEAAKVATPATKTSEVQSMSFSSTDEPDLWDIRSAAEAPVEIVQTRWVAIAFFVLLALAVLAALFGFGRGAGATAGLSTILKIGAVVAVVLFIAFRFKLSADFGGRPAMVALTAAPTAADSDRFPSIDERDLWALRRTAEEPATAAASAESESENAEIKSAADTEATAASNDAATAEQPAADAHEENTHDAATEATASAKAASGGAAAANPPAPNAKSRKPAPPGAVAPANSRVRKSESTAAAPRGEKFPRFKPANPADPTERPKWLTQPIGRQRDTYYTTVMVGPYKSPAECEEEFPAERDKAVKAYVNSYLGPEAARALRIPPAFVNEKVVSEVYYEPVDTTFGPMFNMHVLMAFDGRVRTQWDRLWRDVQVEGRLLKLAGAAGSVLLVLGAAFGCLKLDTLTRGYYTRRLLFATAAVILAILGANLFVALNTLAVSPG